HIQLTPQIRIFMGFINMVGTILRDSFCGWLRMDEDFHLRSRKVVNKDIPFHHPSSYW
ncbi:Hypothetical protein FKW44_018973, partial [Caligus rogercresseyi]